MGMRIVFLVALVSTVMPAPAGAHHPLAELYDRDRTITLTGTVRAVEWANPHVMITVEVADGQDARTWRVEMAPPGGMARRGVRRDQFMAGDVIVVTGYPSKDDGPAAVARTIQLPGGERVEVTDDASWNWQSAGVRS